VTRMTDVPQAPISGEGLLRHLATACAFGRAVQVSSALGSLNVAKWEPGCQRCGMLVLR